jgi:F0F1-type ATP synthase membrane subunit b/b'
MSELEEIGEMIRNAMRLVEQAQEAGEQLRNHANRENLDEFRRQVQELHAELSRLQQVLQHESTYSLDELIDVLSRMFSDHPAAYRRIPPLE